MNKKQQWVVYGCAAIIALMLLFPPFQLHYGGIYREHIQFGGYAFLFSPPGYGDPLIDKGTLLVQWVGVLLVGGILWFAFRGKK